MRILAAVTLLVAHTVAAGVVSRVEGRVTLPDSPLPGCTVMLGTADARRTTVSDADGRYSFPGVPAGVYAITFELPGFTTEHRDIAVAGEVTSVGAVELLLDPAVETLTLGCGGPPCNETDPATPFEWPSCSDYELNTALIESMKREDRSAMDMLRQRHKETLSLIERFRLAGALLGHVSDDREYWNELSEHASVAIRFPWHEDQPSPEFVQWCAERSVDPDEYRWSAYDALHVAAADRRSRSLLLKALETDDRLLVENAITSMLDRPDDTFLPAIEKALQRFPDYADDLAIFLAGFRSEAADRLAMKYLAQNRQEEY